MDRPDAIADPKLNEESLKSVPRVIYALAEPPALLYFYELHEL